VQSFNRTLCRALVEPRAELRVEPCAELRADVQTCSRLFWRLIAETSIETIV